MIAKPAHATPHSRSSPPTKTDEATRIEATPALIIERGEKVFLPPALVFQGRRINGHHRTSPSASPWIIAKPAAAFDLLLLDGVKHTFLNEHPFEPNSVKALKEMIAFIKRHGAARHVSR
ncbi:MAG TPA: hypothetical protein VKX28_15600 [Xanthobacteraceae bacterium]|nr:hypothetical protein [Xanthobacteraceae bacterium]